MNMLNLRKKEGHYYFKLGKGADFMATVYLLKNTFRPEDRGFDDETKEWNVPANEVSEAKLVHIFSNAASVIECFKAQLPLFPEDT